MPPGSGVQVVVADEFLPDASSPAQPSPSGIAQGVTFW